MEELKCEVRKFDNRTEYYCNGLLHRDNDLPAVEWNNGSKAWYQNGLSHRLDGPAAEYENGTKYWWVNGQLHRLDGPAIEWNDGTKSWFIEGKEYSEKKYNKIISSGKN